MAQVSPEISQLLEGALALSTQDRGVLISRLLESLDEEAAEDGVEAAWDAEIAERVEDVRKGRVKLIPGEQVLGRLKIRLRDAKTSAVSTASAVPRTPRKSRRVQQPRLGMILAR